MNTTNINKQNSHLNLENEQVQTVFSLYAKHDEVPYISPDRNLEMWLRQVEIGSESLVPKRNTVRLQDDLLPGHIILLWRISFGTFTNESVFPKYFEYDYGINARQALEEIQDKGYGKQLTAFESLTYINAAHLKSILKIKQVNGLSKLKKADLMNKMADAYTEEELSPLIEVRGYELTDSGKSLLEKYVDIVDKHPKKKY